MKYKIDNKKIEEFHHRGTRSYTELNRGRKKLRIKNSVKLRGYFFFFIFCFLSFSTVTLYAQEVVADAEEASAAEVQSEDGELPPDGETLAAGEETQEETPAPVPLTPEQQRLELEIRTSSLSELAIWSRTLGLSEGGTRADLSKRLREHFELPEPKAAVEDNRKIITIESAQSTEYFTIEIIDEDYARLKGEVRLSLKDKDSVHKIRADEILFNRTRNILTARGRVIYEKVDGDKTETFRGENITVNIDDWSSIFLEGDSERKLTSSSEGTAYRFIGTVISRNDEDVTVLNNARVSNAYNEEALWSISASKLWLLPGSDFAIFNAWLKVGEIPVLYIPFFYYPADEVIFHPVVGFRSREGAFVQTTTYILGRPKANTADQSSLSRILGNSSEMVKERHGLFLRSTGRKATDPNEVSLKAMIDYYTNLGVYLGVDLSTTKKGIFNPLELSLGTGFSRTLTMLDGSYTPYAPDFDGTFDWNSSNLFSTSVPFRYRMKLSSSISGRYGNFNWNIPFYSDPYVDRDFLIRSESMDWFNMIQQGAAAEDSSSSETELPPYQWHLNGQINPSLPILSPYISSISLSSISTTLSFIKIQDSNKNSSDPGRWFFAPDKYTIYSVSGSVSGTPLTVGDGTSSPVEAKEEENPFRDIGVPRSPWPPEAEKEEEKNPGVETLVPPVLNQRFELPRTGNAKFSIGYSLSPTGSSELQFMSGFGRWQSYEQVNWDDVQSILSSFSGNSSINFRMEHSAGFYTNDFSFSAGGTFKEYNYLNEEAEAFRTPQNPQGNKDESRLEEAKKQQYRQTNYTSSYTYNGTLRPLYDNPVFGQSNLQYGFRGTLARSKRYTDGNGPELTPQWGAWVKEKPDEDILGINSHRLTANLAASIMDKQQNITLSADLPPLDGFISTSALFRVWITETSAGIQFRKPETINNEPNSEWKIEPFTLTETLRFGKVGTFTYYMVMAPEDDNEITTITSTLRLWNSFETRFSALKSNRFEFVFRDPDDITQGGEWRQTEDEPSLNPRDLTFTYARTFSNINIIKNRLNFSTNINSRLYFDLQRHTSSNFQFSMGLSVGISNFLDVSFSATSENSVIFRYFKGVPGMESLTAMYSEGSQNNLFLDLFDSFNFADDSKRRSSGFKMKNFNLSATHFLGDWKATFTVSMSPYRNDNTYPPQYEVNADISFLVQWIAISEIKSDIKYEKRTENWIIK
jgi:hypothetical protein